MNLAHVLAEGRRGPRGAWSFSRRASSWSMWSKDVESIAVEFQIRLKSVLRSQSGYWSYATAVEPPRAGGFRRLRLNSLNRCSIVLCLMKITPRFLRGILRLGGISSVE